MILMVLAERMVKDPITGEVDVEEYYAVKHINPKSIMDFEYLEDTDPQEVLVGTLQNIYTCLLTTQLLCYLKERKKVWQDDFEKTLNL